MESLAFLHYAVACQAPTPPPQLRSFGAGMRVVSLAVLLCVGETLSEVMLSDRAAAQAQTNAIGTGIVNTRDNVGVRTRSSPNGAIVGGRVEGMRVFLTGRQADAGGLRWAQLTDGTWVATPYIAYENTATLVVQPVFESWNTDVGAGSRAIVRTRLGVGVNTRNRPAGAPVGGRAEGTRVALTGAQADAGGFRWAQLSDGTWAATPYLALERVTTPSPAPPPPPEPQPEPTPPQGVTQRIQFAPGETSAIVSNTVRQGTRDTYLLQAQGNQTLSAQLTSTQNSASFQVVAPDGTTLVEETTNWQGELPADGDYQIIVRSPQGDTNYSLTVSITEPQPPQGITERIQFAPGETSATLSNTVARDVSNTYLLRATLNQTLSVNLTSTQNDAVFRVVAPDGTTLVQETTNWQGTLPASGDYRVIVRSQRGGASYTLNVSITQPEPTPTPTQPSPGTTERIEFPPGEIATTLNGTVEPDTPTTYLLNVQREEFISVTLDAAQDNAVLDIVDPNGTTLEQGVNFWNGTSSMPGDYRIIVRAEQGSANYSLRVSAANL